LLVFLGALAWGGGVFLQRQRTLDQLNDEINKLASQLKKFEQIKTEKAEIEDRIDYLNTLRQGGPPILEIMKELSERIPKSAWMDRFKFSEKGIEIGGQAAAASQLIPLLEASPMFGGVSFLSAITKTRDGNERFRIRLSLK
jgi:general secretion pathway protein L